MADDIGTYLKAIGRYPVLSPEAQLIHSRRIHAWVQLVETPEPGSLPPPLPPEADPEHLRVERLGRRSLDAMTKTNLRMVLAIAKRYQHKGLDLIDLIQEGNLGLIRGLLLFDPTRGYKISTYAYWWIRQSIGRALHTSGRPVRLPINSYEMLGKISKFVQERKATTGVTPKLQEIAEALNKTETQIKDIIDIFEATKVYSYDAFSPNSESDPGEMGSGPTFAGLIADPASLGSASDSPEDVQLSDDAKAIAEFMDELPEREAYVLQEMFYEGKHPKEIAEDLGLTVTRINQIARSGKFRLKGKLIYLRARRKYGPHASQ